MERRLDEKSRPILTHPLVIPAELLRPVSLSLFLDQLSRQFFDFSAPNGERGKGNGALAALHVSRPDDGATPGSRNA